MLKKLLIAAFVAMLVASLGMPAAGSTKVTYTPTRGDGCGPPSIDGGSWANFVVFSNRVCGSYPWDAQRMLAGGSLAFYNRTSGYRRLVAWKTSTSRSWSLDVGLSSNEIAEMRIYRPGKYVFRDPAHSRLVRFTRRDGSTDTRCLGACAYLRVTY